MPDETLDSTLLGHTFFNSPRLFLFSISIIFMINQPLLKYLFIRIHINMDLKWNWKYAQKPHSK